MFRCLLADELVQGRSWWWWRGGRRGPGPVEEGRLML